MYTMNKYSWIDLLVKDIKENGEIKFKDKKLTVRYTNIGIASDIISYILEANFEYSDDYDMSDSPDFVWCKFNNKTKYKEFKTLVKNIFLL